jgi:sigma-B regulation protein RsbU (phosphoserine phosphatase)
VRRATAWTSRTSPTNPGRRQILRALESTQVPAELRELASIAAVSALNLLSERATGAQDRERVTRFQDELIRIVGHDLRAPLGAIEVGIEMLANASDSTVAIARISSFTRRLSRIVDHVVDLTRARLGGGIPLARSHTRLAPLVTYVVREVAAAHPQHQFLLVDVEDVRGVWDEDRIAQVVRALLTNAAQYGRERGVIEVYVKSHADGAATIAVHNQLQGAPLPEAALATMFDAYRRGSDDAHIGTGIGLSLFLAQQLVHAHRGSISVESSSLGTAFHVVLPDAGVTP